MNSSRSFHILFLIFASGLLFVSADLFSQKINVEKKRSLPATRMDSLQMDSLKAASLQNDTSASMVKDSARLKISKNGLDAPISYKAEDTIIFDVVDQKVFLFGDAQVIYKNIQLNADYIEFDMKNNLLIAEGIKDSLGNIQGEPVFKEDEKAFNAKRIVYNYRTKKGKITQFYAIEGEGYIHGKEVKKNEKDELFVSHAKYTTCNLPDPHFAMAISKLKVVPNKVLIAGPSNLQVENIPTPLGLPFGIFPIKKGQRSGILMPEFRFASQQAGFILDNGGYYFALSDYYDLALRGSFSTRGLWKGNVASSYSKRYKFTGNFRFEYTHIPEGDRIDVANFRTSEFFSLGWKHTKDAKARPGSRFSADVNIKSPGINKYIYDQRNLLQNTLRSSINYGKTWIGKPYAFNVNLSHSQNLISHVMDVTFPHLTFSASRIYPFKRKVSGGSEKWFEKINLSYEMDAKNRASLIDTNLFTLNEQGTSERFNFSLLKEKMEAGMEHRIPVRANFKILKYMTFNPEFQYRERWHTHTIRQEWVDSSLTDTIPGVIMTDTVFGLRTSRDYAAKFSFTTKVYGMYNFKGANLKAIRHVLTPTVSLNFIPGHINNLAYYRRVQIHENKTVDYYSIFDRSIYGGPPEIEVGGISLGLNNNVEMKVRSKKDTITGTKIISLLDNLFLGSSYNMFADSLKWSSLTMTGNTSLFKKFHINFSGAWNPYKIDALGRPVNTFVLDINDGELMRLERFQFGFTTNLTSGKKRERNLQNYDEEEVRMIKDAPDEYVDFLIPWSLGLNYSFNYDPVRTVLVDTVIITQTFNFNLELKFTPKWKVGMRSGYDFLRNDFTPTSISIYRDLHCWDMSIDWIPFGTLKSYGITIKPKAGMLQDLKLTRKKSPGGYYL